jgi:hypothetical protein
MGKKQVLLSSILAALVLVSGAYIFGGVQAYTRYQQSNLERREHCGGQAPVHVCVQAPRAVFSAFYPSYLATQYPLFVVRYSSDSPLTLIISTSIDRFSQTETRTVSADTTTQSSTFVPPLLDSGVLQKLTAESSSLLHIQVTDTKNHLYYRDDLPLMLHSRWLMHWVNAQRLNIAAWVTPDDPTIASLVLKASERLEEPRPGMVGYRKATPQQVIWQVNAIYDALRLDYHIRYVQARIPYNATGDNATQAIKLPAEVLQQRSGMCIELTVLLAAALERIGIQTEIVLIPGHSFLGVFVSEDGKRVEYWDASGLNNNVAGDSANIQANQLYEQQLKQRTILDIITLSEARNARVGPML